ncbi:MAG: zinc ABC transporter substrate-binding protein [Candidatus Muproteobacteria bacterium RBG_16_62_13]|uniref:Zinc ABC transporter substrate-binding protein n=1 Tax=Candidatus Muproteobacteria bacterium RBG_16_62_13 TaxID=1817756 RepID=A0A1F6T3Q4_9PROT|nr:MAG: zinc ABC transporter substrate-binding protein [Candidatus Muproteobacteria bacterium RBG_16_62_13]
MNADKRRLVSKLGFLAVCGCALLWSTAPHADLRIFACEPEWAALARELGGNDVKIFTATSARQDPHHIEARPSLIARMRQADLAVCTGAELEAGWLPALLQQSGNDKVQTGSPGYFEAAAFVTLLDVPKRIDRGAGDIHAAGDPHFHTDPRAVLKVAEALAKRLATIDPKQAAGYRRRHEDFARRWRVAIARWEREGAVLKGKRAISLHKSWTYLYRWLGIQEVAVLEPRPGVPPTSSHLAQILAQQKQSPAQMIVLAGYQDPQAAQWLHERSGLPVIKLPYTVGGNEKAVDLFALFDDTLARLKGAIR